MANPIRRERALKMWVQRRTPMPKRFWDKVIKKGADDCWNYIGPFQGFGHGTFSYKWVVYSAHRMAWELANGKIPKGKWVLHKCDNPPCCNPKHLYLGTAKENGRDSSIRKRYPKRTGQSAANAILTDAQASEIKRRYIPKVVTQFQLSKEYGVSESTIQWIVSGRHFKDIS